MRSLDGAARHLESRGLYLALRLGPCGQWKIRLYDREGRKRYEALTATPERALTLALRRIDYATPCDVAA